MTTYTHVLHSSAVSWGKNPSYALPYDELSLYVLSEEHADAWPVGGHLRQLTLDRLLRSHLTGRACRPHTETQRSWYCILSQTMGSLKGLGHYVRLLVPDEGSPGRHNGSCNKPPLGCYKHVCVWVHVYTRISSCHRTTAPWQEPCGSPPDICLQGIFLETMIPTSSAARNIKTWRVGGVSLPVRVLHISGISMLIVYISTCFNTNYCFGAAMLCFTALFMQLVDSTRQMDLGKKSNYVRNGQLGSF